jgi:hypothetical protein
MGLLEASDELIITLPLYVPAFMLDAFTATFTEPGVLPPPVAESQLPPDVEML